MTHIELVDDYAHRAPDINLWEKKYIYK
jgi:hypothetical protein